MISRFPIAASLLASGAALALSPDSSSSPLQILAESPALETRMQRPWNHFLLDGQTSLAPGDLFYAEQRFSAAERFSLMPEFRIAPDFASEDTARYALGFHAGNEVGDAMLRELQGEGGEGNRTPFTRGRMRLAPLTSARLALEADQNDHLSYRTFPRRSATLGGRPWEDLSYLGENLPPLSLLRGGVEVNRRGGSLQIAHARGFAWGQSRVTGEAYPLDVEGTEVQAGVDENLRMRFRYYGYEGVSDNARYAPTASLSEVGLNVGGGEGGDWGWNFAWAYRSRLIEPGSAWARQDEGSYPWAFRGGKTWKHDERPLKAKARGALEYDEAVLLSRLGFEAEEVLKKKHVFTQNWRAYLRRSFDDSAFVAEKFPGDSSPVSGYDVPGNGRGMGLTAGYVFRDSLWEAGLSGSGSMEWSAPRFVGVDMPPVGGAPSFWNSRAGIYRGSDHALQRWQGNAFAEAAVKMLRLRAAAGGQLFAGAEADSLEFIPSPYFGEIAAKLALPRGLSAETKLQGLGPKRYHGFGVSLRTPPHFENHLGVEQALFAKALTARLAFFHAFGDAVLEHPLGNPIRFRIVAGLDWRLP